MNQDISRRTLIAGASWAAPVVLATTTVPAYAASAKCLPDSSKGGLKIHENTKQELVWNVPSDAKEVHFEVIGGAGGSFSSEDASGIGGAGAVVKGLIRVEGGKGEFKFIAGAGGNYRQGRPVGPGAGYGNGGSHGDTLKEDPNDKNTHEYFGPTGGGASAILLDEQPIVIAGGGGGAGIFFNRRERDTPQDLYWQMFEPIYGGVGGEKSSDGTNATATFASDDSAAIRANGGHGAGANGAGGEGGAQPEITLPTGRVSAEPTDGIDLTNNVIAGNKGGDAGVGSKADGAPSAAQFSSITYKGVTSTMIVHSGTGGGGYGGGGSGSVAALAAYMTDGDSGNSVTPDDYKGYTPGDGESKEENSKNEANKGVTRTATGATCAGAFGGPGGAGGSFISPKVENSTVATSDKPGVVGERIDGAIRFWYC